MHCQIYRTIFRWGSWTDRKPPLCSIVHSNHPWARSALSLSTSTNWNLEARSQYNAPKGHSIVTQQRIGLWWSAPEPECGSGFERKGGGDTVSCEFEHGWHVRSCSPILATFFRFLPIIVNLGAKWNQPWRVCDLHSGRWESSFPDNCCGLCMSRLVIEMSK